MSDLIRKQDAVSKISDLLLIELQGKRIPTWNEVYHAINDIPSLEPERKKGTELLLCNGCAYWMDKCVYLNDGRIRKYADGEKFVGADVGINEGAKCLYDEKHGVHLGGYAIFRQANDYCSKAEKRHTDYDTWYGIVDGIYARRWRCDDEN